MATTRDFLLLHWKRLAVDFCLCVHVAVMSILRFDSLLQSLVCVKVPETAGPSYPCSLVGLGIIARVSSLIFRLPATIIAHTGAVLPYGTAPAPQELWTFVILCSSSLLMCVIISAPRFYILQARSYFWLVGNFLTSTAAFSSLIMCPDHPASIYHTKFLHIPGPFLILQQIVLQYDRTTGLSIALVWFCSSVLSMLLLPSVHPEVYVPWWAIPFLVICTLGAVHACLRLHCKHMRQLSAIGKKASSTAATRIGAGLHANISGATDANLDKAQASGGSETTDVLETVPRGQNVLRQRHLIGADSFHQGSSSYSYSSNIMSVSPSLPSISPSTHTFSSQASSSHASISQLKPVATKSVVSDTSSGPPGIDPAHKVRHVPMPAGAAVDPPASSYLDIDNQSQPMKTGADVQHLLSTIGPHTNAMFKPEGAIETITTTIYGLHADDIPSDFLEQLNRSLMSDPSHPRMIVSASLRNN